MDFTRLSFWLVLLAALPVMALLQVLLRRHEVVLRHVYQCFLLLLSLGLLGMVSTVTLLIFVGVMLTAYAACRVGLRLPQTGRRVLLGLLVPLLLLPLGYYKYGYFLGVTVLHQPWDSLRDLVIPVGISFYSFQILGFCIDTLLRGLPMPRLLDYMNFCAFFPQIAAGPIERRESLLPQMQQPETRFRAAHWDAGLRYVVSGLFFKLALADNLAAAFSADYSGGSALHLWLNNLLFTFRIYFDFAGYALSAFGLARCMGVQVQLNFRSPYTACHVGDFWRRWNITLMQWFRDYLYIPLGGNRTRLWWLAVLLVFLVSGIWHGAGWNFMLWGLLAGVTVVLHRLFRLCGGHLPAPLGWALTFGTMVFLWQFFYDTDPALLKQHLRLLVTPSAYAPALLVQELTDMKTAGTMVLPFLLLSFLLIAAEGYSFRRCGNPYALFTGTVACGVLVFLTVLLVPAASSPFIYFAF